MNPITLGGLALTGGSVIANLFRDDDQRRQRELALRNAEMMDAAYAQQGQEILGRARNRYAGFGAGMDQRGRELGDYFVSQSVPAQGGGNTSAVPVQGASKPTSGIMAGETAKQTGNAQAYNTQQGKALGNLRGFDQYLGDTNRMVGRDFNELATNQNFRRGNLNLLPAQLAAAQGANRGLGTIADLLRGGGNILTAYSMQPGVPGPNEKPFSRSLVPNSFGGLRKVNIFDLFG
jgi:hypothetical protein